MSISSILAALLLSPALASSAAYDTPDFSFSDETRAEIVSFASAIETALISAGLIPSPFASAPSASAGTGSTALAGGAGSGGGSGSAGATVGAATTANTQTAATDADNTADANTLTAGNTATATTASDDTETDPIFDLASTGSSLFDPAVATGSTNEPVTAGTPSANLSVVPLPATLGLLGLGVLTLGVFRRKKA